MKTRKIEMRRVLLLLPLFIIPLLAGGFYLLGGGKQPGVGKEVKSAGINIQLPDAKFKSDTLDGKMLVYDQVQASGEDTTSSAKSFAERLGFGSIEEDPKVKAIDEKLAMLHTELARPVEMKPERNGGSKTGGSGGGMGGDIEKLEKLMKSMQGGKAEDPEMKQLSAILQSIQEIGNPDLARLKYKALAAGDTITGELFGAIPAVVDGNQKAVQGSVLRLKLLDSVVLNGQVVPKGHLVYGLCSFSNQRLNLEIKNIRMGNSIVPVNLTVFDRRDAMIGINAPEAVLADAVSGGVVEAAGSFGISGFDLPSQLAGAGIDAARSLLTKRLKRIKQPIKSGYQVLLRDNTRKK